MSTLQDVLGVRIIAYLNDFSVLPVNSSIGSYDGSMAAGLKALVHVAGTAPNMDDALSAGPGTETTMVISSIERTRLSTPYGIQCTDQKMIEGSATLKYTENDCTDVCIQSVVYDSTYTHTHTHPQAHARTMP